jgi:hypothetical protein
MSYPLTVDRVSKGFCVLALGLMASLGFAYFPASSAPISVEHIGTNKIGKFLASEVTEQISASQSLRVGEDAADGWKLVLLTSDGEGATFYSVVVVRKQAEQVFDQYVLVFHGICAVDRLEHCAGEIVRKAQEPITQFEAEWREMSGPDTKVGR